MDYSHYPERSLQLQWLHSYLEAYKEHKGQGSEVTETEVEVLYVQVNRFSLVSSLLLFCVVNLWFPPKTKLANLRTFVTFLLEFCLRDEVFSGTLTQGSQRVAFLGKVERLFLKLFNREIFNASHLCLFDVLSSLLCPSTSLFLHPLRSSPLTSFRETTQCTQHKSIAQGCVC